MRAVFISVSIGACDYGTPSQGVKVVMDIVKQLRGALGPAIDAARSALRSIDADDVPTRLRSVARAGEGTLPVPLVKALLRGIDEDEWFRSKVLEAFERADVADPVSEAYLRRESGWWIDIARAAGAGLVENADRRAAQARAELESARESLRVARQKAKTLKKELVGAEAAARASIEARLEPVRSAASEARADAVRAEARVTELESELVQARWEAAEASREAAARADDLRRARKVIADLRRTSETGDSESMPRGPVEIARWLDRARIAAAPYREAAGASGSLAEPAPSSGWRLPAGVAPDAPEAIDALAGVDGVAVLVDGHNLLGAIDEATMASSRARRDLVVSLARLRRHLGDSRVEVVFDSRLRDGRPVAVSDSGIVVRFAEEGRLADDVLVDLAKEWGAGAIVVSDDREVRERAGANGAAALWAKSLAEWL